jgi:hypothetical protein
MSALDLDAISSSSSSSSTLGINGSSGVVAARAVLLGLQHAANLAFEQQYGIVELAQALSAVEVNTAAARVACSLARSFKCTLHKLQDMQCPPTYVELEGHVVLWKLHSELLDSSRGGRAAVSRIEVLLQQLPAAEVQQMPRQLQRWLDGRNKRMSD